MPGRSAPRTMDPDARFASVVEAFRGEPGVTTGRMMASLGLRVGGKIFAMLVRGRLVVKLPRERVDALVDAGQGERFDPRRDGRVMKEWVVLEGSGTPWLEVAREAHRFVSRSARAQRGRR